MPPSLDEEADAASSRRPADFRRQKRIRKVEADRLPPHSIEAEQGVLGCILINPKDCLCECYERFKVGHEIFYDLRHQTIYQAMCELFDQLEPVELITLQQRLKDNGTLDQIGGIPYLSNLSDTTPSAENLTAYIDIIEEKWTLRRVLVSCTEIVGRVYDSEGEAESILGDFDKAASSIEVSKAQPTLDSKAAGELMLADLERRMALEGKLPGLPTGFKGLDSMTSGLQAGEQFIIGARPSQGKTALGLCLMSHIGFSGEPCLFISLEMSIQSIMRRLLAIRSHVPLKSLKEGMLSGESMAKIAMFHAELNRAPLFFHDGIQGMNIREVASRIRRHTIKYGIKMVVIDYLQKIRAAGKYEKRSLEVAEVSARLKAIAHENKVAMVTLAQLNRESVKGGGKGDSTRAPRISDLRECGDIEQDADTICMIHRKSENETMLIVGKQRDGEVGGVPLYFNKPYAQFTGMEEDE